MSKLYSKMWGEETFAKYRYGNLDKFIMTKFLEIFE